MQGYLLSRPLPAAQLVAWLQRPPGDGNSLRAALQAESKPARPGRGSARALADSATG